jgi:hypothetical protein
MLRSDPNTRRSGRALLAGALGGVAAAVAGATELWFCKGGTTWVKLA